MRGISALVAFLVSVSLCALAGAGDWPRFRGVNGDGISSETGINKEWGKQAPKELWKVALSDGGYAGPSVADGKVFIIDHKGKNDVVRAIDLKTGNGVWIFEYPDADSSNFGFSRSTPTYEDGKLYTFSRLGKVHCLDAATGKKIWMKDIIAEFGGQRPGWDMAMSITIDGDALIVCPGGNDASVATLNKATGATLWKGGGSDKPGYATPVIATINGKKQYVIFTGKGVMGVDAAAGAKIWSFPWKTSYDVNAAMPIVMGDTVLITSNYGSGGALLDVKGDSATQVWKNKAIQSHFSTPILLDGLIYGTTDPGDLICMDPKTGVAKWREKGFEKGGAIAVDGTIIVLDGKHGDLVMAAIDPAGYKELGRIKPLGGQSWTAPVLANGKLIIRNKEAMVCLDLSAGK